SIDAIPDKPTIRKTCLDPAIVPLPVNHATELENKLDIALLTQSFRRRKYGNTNAEEWLPGHTPPEIRQRYGDGQKKAWQIIERETSSQDGSVDRSDSQNLPKLHVPVTPPSSSEEQPSGQRWFNEAGANLQSESTTTRGKEATTVIKPRRKRCYAEIDSEAEPEHVLRGIVVTVRRSSRLRGQATGMCASMGSFYQPSKRSRYMTSGAGK
ncbi:hypothetical protein LTS18_009156, partial [Coniosporium uncinatum]